MYSVLLQPYQSAQTGTQNRTGHVAMATQSRLTSTRFKDRVSALEDSKTEMSKLQRDLPGSFPECLRFLVFSF